MKNTRKKVLLILVMILLVLIACIAAVTVMIFTGKVALTDKQKLAKGLNDLSTRLGEVSVIQDNDTYDKMVTEPFKLETTITGSLDKLEFEEAAGAEQILQELKEIVQKTTITNTLEADWKNNQINESIKIEMGDIIEQLSLDFQYNKDTIALRSKELNEKYMTFTKAGVEGNEQYEELATTFEAFEQMCQQVDLSKLEFTEEEKLHFTKNYSGIFPKYLTEDTIISEKSKINIDGAVKDCSVVTLTFDKKQIQAIIGEYLQLFENDVTGKNIIINKIKVLSEDFSEEDLIKEIQEIRDDIVNIEEDSKISVSVYATMLETYGIIIDVIGVDSTQITMILGKEAIDVNLKVEEQQLATATITKNEVNVVAGDEDVETTMNIKEENNKNIIVLGIKELEANENVNITITREQVSKTESESIEKNTIMFEAVAEDVKLAFTINGVSKLQYITSVTETTLNNENSLDLVNAPVETLQSYVMELQNKGTALLQKAQQNSVIVTTLLQGYQDVENTVDDVDTNKIAVESFNNNFKVYEGQQNGTMIKGLLQLIATNNQTATAGTNSGSAAALEGVHSIAVVIIEGNTILVNTADTAQIILAINSVSSADQYTVVIPEYDTEGYIKTIAIKKNV